MRNPPKRFNCGCKITLGRTKGAFAIYPCEYHVGRLNTVSWPLSRLERRIESDAKKKRNAPA